MRLQYGSVQTREAFSAEAWGGRNACHLDVLGGQEGNRGVCICLCVRLKDSERKRYERVWERFSFMPCIIMLMFVSAWWEGVLDIEGA